MKNVDKLKKLFYKSNPRSGISLITLVITIIVVIILAGAVILSLTNNNPIETANEAVFKSDISAILEQLDLYEINQFTINHGEFDSRTMNGKVSDFVPSVTKYDNELRILNGKLSYIGDDFQRAAMVEELSGKQDIVEVGGLKYNRPDLSYLPEATTKAVKWDSDNVESEITVSQAKLDTSWYDYSTKKWANIYTNNNENKAYWVWIPRYAYKIDHPHTATAEQIHIKFLSGTSNVAADGSSISGYTVHPAFTFGGEQLLGIWVAKYEASSSDPNKVEASGTYAGANLGGGNVVNLQVRVLPDVYSWRNISTGSAQTVSMNMINSDGSIGTSTNIDTHQIKNVEWGAVAYLSQSEYGTVPWINPYGDVANNSWKMKTGYAGSSKDSGVLAEGNANLFKYDTTNGVKASTTGNIYGIYDMNGGASERTAALLNNGNTNIGTFGKAEHIQSNKIKEEYAKYYDIYELSDEENEGGMYYGAGGAVLWNSGNAQSQNIIRKTITDTTYAKCANRKGDALWEISADNSYYGMYTTGTSGWGWFKTTTARDSSQGADYARAWNGDFILIGHANQLWFNRGGNFMSDSGAGIFASINNGGSTYPSDSFRPVLVTGLDL